MAAIPYTRAEHRTSFKLKTQSKVSVAADQDYYIDKAEAEVLQEFAAFHPGIQRQAKDSAATSSSGILLMDQGFTRLETLKDASKNKYDYIDDPDEYDEGTGYYFLGFDATNKKYQIMVVKAGTGLNVETLYWFNLKSIAMATASTDVSAIPDGFKECIDYLAAKKYWEDQGSAAQEKQARYFAREYEALLAKARGIWGNPTRDAEFCESVSPDAGEAGNTMTHHVA